MSEERIVPAIVIGLGIAGVTAGVYLSRMGIDPLAFEGDRIGGHINKLSSVTDYAGFEGSGQQLSDELRKQLEFNKIEVVNKYVTALYKDEDGLFVVKTDEGSYKAKAVVLASGLARKSIIDGKGIEVVDNPLLDVEKIQGKKIAIYGGGRLAYQATIDLSSKAKEIILARKSCEAPLTLKEKAESLDNVKVIENDNSIDLNGVSRIYDLPSKIRMVGASKYCLIKEIIDDQGTIAVGKDNQTFVKGIFAAGDIIQKGYKSLASGVYDGAIVGVMIYRLLTGMNEVS